MAARLRRELNAEVEMVHGRYGQFQVLVGGKAVVDGGPLAALGILPAPKNVVAAVRAALMHGLS